MTAAPAELADPGTCPDPAALAERNLIGSALLLGSGEPTAGLRGEDWSDPRCRRAAEAIGYLAARGEPIGLATAHALLDRWPGDARWGAEGLAGWLAGAVDEVWLASAWPAGRAVVEDAGRRRRVAAAAQRLEQAAECSDWPVVVELAGELARAVAA